MNMRENHVNKNYNSTGLCTLFRMVLLPVSSLLERTKFSIPLSVNQTWKLSRV